MFGLHVTELGHVPLAGSCKYGFYKRRRTSWVSEWLLASQEELCSMELIKTYKEASLLLKR